MDTLELANGDQTTVIIFFRNDPLYLITPPLLSALATLIVIISGLTTRFYNDPLQKMVLLINLADFLYCTIHLIVPLISLQSNLYCRIAFAIYHFGYNSSIIWGAMFGHALYTYIKTRRIDQLTSNLKYYIAFATLLPFLFALGVFISTDYLTFGEKENSCIHSFNGKTDTQSLYLVSLPANFSFLLNLIYYAVAIKKLSNIVSEENKRSLLILAIYPLVLIVCFAPFTLFYLLKSFWLNFSGRVSEIMYSTTQLQGFFDAIVYGGGVTNVCKKFRQIICICVKKKPPEGVNNETEIISEKSASVIYLRTESFKEYKESFLR